MTKIAVRDGQLVVPTCPDCGCRLRKIKDTIYEHWYESFTKKDARGHSCVSVLGSFKVEQGRVSLI